jgi:hypothetical protein
MKFHEKIKLNFKPIVNLTLKIDAFLFSAISILLVFITWIDLKIFNVLEKILIFVSIIIFSFLLSTILIVSI